jgi:glycerophosphoryl diester phosphodiesterase
MPDRKHNLPLADLFSRVKRDFSKNLANLLLFDVFFKIIAAALFGPVSAWIFNRLVASSGAWVIGNEQIISFVLSPIGMTAVIISGALALAITFAEQAGVILIASRFNAGRKITAYQAFLQMLKYLRVLIELGLRQVIIGLLYLAPLAAIVGIGFYLLSSQQDLNYLLVEKPPAYWTGMAIAAVLGMSALFVITRLYIRWIFSVPLCVIEDQRPVGALRDSRSLVSGNFWRISAIILGWALVTIGVGVLSAFILEFLSEFILNRLGENPAVSFWGYSDWQQLQ